MDEVNKISMDTICGALCYAMGIEPPKEAAEPNEAIVSYVDEALHGEKADRIVMFNPDAVAQWIVEKYPQFVVEPDLYGTLKVPLCTVMPSVTPVCFGTMYTGAQPSVHGIRKYEKPVIRIDTIFDALIRAGKKPVIVAHKACSLGKIFLERDMDYFLYDSWSEVNAKAHELLLEDKHDFYVIYNGNYDHTMHHSGPESKEALAELRCNAREFGSVYMTVLEHFRAHNTLLGWAMDHGCHEIDGHCGSHGLDMPEDLNILHRYVAIPRA